MKSNIFAAALLGAATLIACNNSTSEAITEENAIDYGNHKKGYQPPHHS